MIKKGVQLLAMFVAQKENYEKSSWVTTWLRPEQGHETTAEDPFFFETFPAFLKGRLDIEKHKFKSQINRDGGDDISD